jgi:anti-anti-sigma factor
MAALGTVKRRKRVKTWTDDVQRCGSATFSARHADPTRVVVTVVGDIDALNARALGRYVERHARMSKQLVLDLRAVDFAGAQAFTALYYVSVHCARRDVDWIIIGNRCVRHLLSICDPDGQLPMVDDLAAGLSRLDYLAQRHYHVAGAGTSATLARQRIGRPPVTATRAPDM